MKVNLGLVMMTVGVKVLCNDSEDFKQDLNVSIQKHSLGDWGDVCPDEDKELNDEALVNGGRLMSVYEHDNSKYWIITEADRSLTTILLPEEY